MKCTVCRNSQGEACKVIHGTGSNKHEEQANLCPGCQAAMRLTDAKVEAFSAVDTCAWCGKDLATQDFCWADGVDLYCSVSHGMKDCQQTELEFMDHAECVGTEDIGIKSPKQACHICDTVTDVLVSTQEHGPICCDCNNELRANGEEVSYNVDA